LPRSRGVKQFADQLEQDATTYPGMIVAALIVKYNEYVSTKASMSAVDKREGSLRCPQKFSASAPIKVGMVEPKLYAVIEVQ
jgi:hypothetical protein